MIIAMLAVLGLCLGSFVNALDWRIRQQEHPPKGKRNGKGASASIRKAGKTALTAGDDFSILRGRSMCPHCRHTLAAGDLVPLFSWLSLRGRCRYCRKPIHWQYPAVEAATAALFAASYLAWPDALAGYAIVNFALWLVMLTGLMALLVYDVRWMELPNRITYPLLGLAALDPVIRAIDTGSLGRLWQAAFAAALLGGLFWILFEVSDGKWIGGGDVKLGAILGLLVGHPYLAMGVMFLASVLGLLSVLPGLVKGDVKMSSKIPFGPFLIVAGIIVKLFGAGFIEWYKNRLLIGV
jgi:leader peptidase (prepilin peptidase)/N-methyltransferase